MVFHTGDLAFFDDLRFGINIPSGEPQIKVDEPLPRLVFADVHFAVRHGWTRSLLHGQRGTGFLKLTFELLDTFGFGAQFLGEFLFRGVFFGLDFLTGERLLDARHLFRIEDALFVPFAVRVVDPLDEHEQEFQIEHRVLGTDARLAMDGDVSGFDDVLERIQHFLVADRAFESGFVD